MVPEGWRVGGDVEEFGGIWGGGNRKAQPSNLNTFTVWWWCEDEYETGEMIPLQLTAYSSMLDSGI